MKKSAYWFLNVVLLLALVLGSAMMPAQVLGEDLSRTVVASPATGAAPPGVSLGEPPLELTVTGDAPLQVPFKLDLEMMLGPYSNQNTYRLDQPASWGSPGFVEQTVSRSDVAAVPVGGERFLAVWMDDVAGALRAFVGWPQSDYPGVATNLGLKAKGNSVLAPLTPDLVLALARDTGDFVQFRWWQGTEGDPWVGAWQQVPGNYRVGSDLAAVAKDSSHVALFFRDSGSGTVKFTEWQAGVDWRSEPIDLGNPPGTQIVSELAAVSRNERHLAVFGVGQDNVLYCREWTNLNQSDWSDTAWTQVLPHVWNNGRISAASRHNNHMAVAVIRTDHSVAYQEWLAASGWGNPQALGNPGFPPTQAPTIAVSAIDTMIFLGVDSGGTLKRNVCGPAPGKCSGWTNWTDMWQPDQHVAAAVRRPHDLIVLGRALPEFPWSNRVSFVQYTREFVNPVPRLVGANHNWADINGQVIATVQGKTIWVDVCPTSTYGCQMAAAETSNWSVSGWAQLDNGLCDGTGRSVAVDAGDLDGDGDDEVVVVTPVGQSIDTSVVQIGYQGTPALRLTPEQKKRQWLGEGSEPQQVDVAIGDLDGDGRKNEVVVAYNTTPGPHEYGTTGVYLYQYQNDQGLQLQGQPQSFSPWTEGDQPPATVWDFEIAVGKVRATADNHEQLVLGAEWGVPGKKQWSVFWGAYLYEWLKDQRGDRRLVKIEQLYDPPSYPEEAIGHGSDHSIALATGDLVGDGLEEVVFSNPLELYTSAGSLPGSISQKRYEAAVRLLAVGDIDGDSRAEILRFTDLYAGTLEIIDWSDVTHDVEFHPKTNLYVTGQLVGFKGVPLLADLDNDSLRARLRECKDYRDVNVIAVVNGVPRYYEDDEPIQENGGGYATGNTDIEGQENGTTALYGGSVAMGYEKEVHVPFVFKGKLSVEAEAEFLGRSGQSTETETSTKMERGAKFDQEDRGMVVFRDASYKCCAFDVYYPAAPDDTSTTLSCTPATVKTQQNATLLRNWHSESFKTTAGPSWVDVGRAAAAEEQRWKGDEISNDVFNYPSQIPTDPYLVQWYDSRAKIEVDPTVSATALEKTWALEKGKGEKQVKQGSFENRDTVSVGVEVYGVELKVAAIAGVEKEWSHSVGWEETLSFEGEVFDYPSSCPTDVCKGSYTVQPFLWLATATTKAGVTYPYLELDYYVPDPPGTLAAAAEAEPAQQAVVGLAPQQPVATSPTHPDPEAWYTSRDVTLEWSQPAGDPAVVTGYRWNLNEESDFTPTALHRVMTDTMTFVGVADGLHYFHLQARGDGGDDSPVAHRAVRVDATPPQVEILLDPPAPDGLNGWYRTPVMATVAATDVANSGDSVGSGVATVEVSTDGTTWQPYTAPIAFNNPTAGITLWARATDQAGHTSEPVSTNLKIDLVAPSSVDSDGVGLSYHNVSTDELGNSQLMLGGASADTLAGRFLVEVKGGDTGPWQPVHDVGEFAMPSGNELDSTVKTLNWLYTPTREIRGIYPLRGRSVDAAGHVEEEWAFGTLWWEPEGDPDLSQSRASVAPAHAFPGDTVRLTLGIRNTGVQEAQVAVTHTLPAGLTPWLESIGDGGRYDAASGAIRWTLHGLWPGQTRFLSFDAQVDPNLNPSEPLDLENRLDLLGYWPWEPLAGGPPEPPTHPYSTATTLTVLPQARAQEAAAQAATQPPAIYTARVLEGAIVDKPLATLYLHTSPDAEFLYVKEWVWDHDQGNWALADKSGWLTFTQGDNLVVTQDSTGKYGQLTWQLSTGDGVKFLGVWAANSDKHTTNLNEGLLLFTNFVSPSGRHLAAGQRVQYRLPMSAGHLALIALATEWGDADLYAWKPRFAFRPHYLSNDTGDGLQVEGLGFAATEYGVHLVEVEAAGQDSFYRLLVGGDVPGATSPDKVRAALGLPPEEGGSRMLLPGVQLPLSKKDRPAHPLTLSTPYGLPDAEDLDDVPQPEWEFKGYLPLAFKEG